MNPSDTYLETEVATATPQRLRLMLIEAAIRRVHQAEASFAAGNPDEACAALARAREIVGELIGGVQPERAPLARAVLGIYAFVLSTLAEVGLTRDPRPLGGILRVLEEERQTWQDVCRLLPDRVSEPAPAPEEELAPQRVPHTLHQNFTQASEAFSIDA